MSKFPKRIDPAAGKLFPTKQEAKELLLAFVQEHSGFKQVGPFYKKQLGLLKERKKIYVALSVQRKEMDTYAWVIRFTLKGKKIIRQELGLVRGDSLPTIEKCFDILCRKYFPDMYSQ